MKGEEVAETQREASNKTWIKVVGYLVAGAFMVAGWIYAGIMTQYSTRIVKLEERSEINRSDIKSLQMQTVRFEEMFKAMNAKLDIIIEQHKDEARK